MAVNPSAAWPSCPDATAAARQAYPSATHRNNPQDAARDVQPDEAGHNQKAIPTSLAHRHCDRRSTGNGLRWRRAYPCVDNPTANGLPRTDRSPTANVNPDPNRQSFANVDTASDRQPYTNKHARAHNCAYRGANPIPYNCAYRGGPNRARRDACSNARKHPYFHNCAHRHCHTRPNTNSRARCTDTHANPGTHTCAHCYAVAVAYYHAHTHCNAYARANTHPHAVANARANADTCPNADAYICPGRQPGARLFLASSYRGNR